MNEWQNWILFISIILTLSLGAALTYFTTALVISNGFQEEQETETTTGEKPKSTITEYPAVIVNTTSTLYGKAKQKEAGITKDNAETATKNINFMCTAKQLLRCNPQGCECR